MNEKLRKLLNEFANSHSIATNIDVMIDDHCKSFKPRNGDYSNGCSYDEVIFLSSLIQGAESFCYFLARKGYKVVKSGKK